MPSTAGAMLTEGVRPSRLAATMRRQCVRCSGRRSCYQARQVRVSTLTGRPRQSQSDLTECPIRRMARSGPCRRADDAGRAATGCQNESTWQRSPVHQSETRTLLCSAPLLCVAISGFLVVRCHCQRGHHVRNRRRRVLHLLASVPGSPPEMCTTLVRADEPRNNDGGRKSHGRCRRLSVCSRSGGPQATWPRRGGSSTCEDRAGEVLRLGPRFQRGRYTPAGPSSRRAESARLYSQSLHSDEKPLTCCVPYGAGSVAS